MPQRLWGGQRTSLCSHFLLYTYMWVLGVRVGSLDLPSKCLHPLSRPSHQPYLYYFEPPPHWHTQWLQHLTFQQHWVSAVGTLFNFPHVLPAFFFLIIALLRGARWNFNTVLACISLMAQGCWTFFQIFIGHLLFFFEICPLSSLAQFLTWEFGLWCSTFAALYILDSNALVNA